jgi:hemoglobin
MEHKDIEGIDDIKWLVDTFYGKVRADGLLGPIFMSHIGEDWSSHLNTMYNFWNMVLFGADDYTGHPFQKHRHLPVDNLHFDRWLLYFNETINERFSGPKTEEIKTKAGNIAAVFLHRILSLRTS